MTANNTETERVQTDPEIARRMAELAADDINTYADTGGALALWPRDFAKPRTSNIGERNIWHIPVDLRPYYNRTREEDQRILASLPREWATLSNDMDPLGPPVPLSHRNPDELLHAFAMRRARDSKREAERQTTEDRKDQTERTCHACGIVDADTVRTRTIGAWQDKLGHAGPRLCYSCAKVAIRQVMAAWDQSVSRLAAETTPNGRRSSVVAEWVADNHRKVLL